MATTSGNSSSGGSSVAGTYGIPQCYLNTFTASIENYEESDSDSVGRESSGASITAPDAVLESNGRTYHGYKEGKYFLPNDGIEQDRLDMQHQMSLLNLDGKLYRAPLDGDPPNVLDIATGTGIWALQFAEQHPNSRVIGTDLSRIQPDPRVPNCQFIQDDVEDEWLYPQKFDFVHLRGVVTCFNRPKEVMRRAFEHMNPGGWIEYCDGLWAIYSPDGSHIGTDIDKWCERTFFGAANLGRDLNVPKYYEEWLKEVGFVDVTFEPLPTPGNSWPRDRKAKMVGMYFCEEMTMGLDGISRKMLLAAGMSPTEIQDFIPKVKSAMKDTAIHWVWPGVLVYGRKPFEWEIVATTE